MNTKPIHYCHTCGKETRWNLILCEVIYHGVVPAYKCEQCEKTVPAFAMSRYECEGKVVIPV